ncbi:MAG: arginine repressor [Gemmatimonadota bacterium]
MSERERRRRRILEIIEGRPVGTQEELAEALAESGFDASQSTVSRDVAELGLVKVDGSWRKPPAGMERAENPAETRIAEGVLRHAAAGDHLIVLFTLPGDAQGVARALDALGWPEVTGTLAGDDTIFVAVPDRAARARLLRRLSRLER